jgi:hypothetical protein
MVRLGRQKRQMGPVHHDYFRLVSGICRRAGARTTFAIGKPFPRKLPCELQHRPQCHGER